MDFLQTLLQDDKIQAKCMQTKAEFHAKYYLLVVFIKRYAKNHEIFMQNNITLYVVPNQKVC